MIAIKWTEKDVRSNLIWYIKRYRYLLSFPFIQRMVNQVIPINAPTNKNTTIGVHNAIIRARFNLIVGRVTKNLTDSW